MNKQTLIRGTLILAVAALFNRMLGVVQRIPLQHIFGDEGMAYFGSAYNVYGILLIVATAGIPTAISKQIAEYTSRNEINKARKVYRAGLYVTVSMGFILSVLLYLLAPVYATATHNPNATLAIRTIAPSVFLFAIIAVMRGYTQGQQWMSPTSWSQIWEQIIRVGSAIFLAFFLIRHGYSIIVGAAGGSFGATAGGVAALIVMIFYTRKLHKEENHALAADDASLLSYKEIYRSMFRISLPVVISAAAISVINFIDTSTVIPLLEPTMGNDAATDEMGILSGRAQTIAGIAPILAIALSSAIVPAIATAFSNRNLKTVNSLTNTSIRLAAITGLPAAFGLAAIAYPLNGGLFGDTLGSLAISVMCVFSIFQILMLTTTAIIQGLDRPNLPMKHVIIGLIVKVVANMVFVPLFGLSGASLATGVALMVMVILNFRSMKKLIGFTFWEKKMALTLLSAGIMAFGALSVVAIGELLLPGPHSRLFQLCVVFLSIAVGGLIYLVSIARFDVMDEDEMKRFPGTFQKVYRVLSKRQRNASS